MQKKFFYYTIPKFDSPNPVLLSHLPFSISLSLLYSLNMLCGSFRNIPNHISLSLSLSRYSVSELSELNSPLIVVSSEQIGPCVIRRSLLLHSPSVFCLSFDPTVKRETLPKKSHTYSPLHNPRNPNISPQKLSPFQAFK